VRLRLPQHQLGKGGFGAVYLGKDKATVRWRCFFQRRPLIDCLSGVRRASQGKPVAIKKMVVNKKNRIEYLLIETEVCARTLSEQQHSMPSSIDFWHRTVACKIIGASERRAVHR
jgi:serine/threonine protein kinase